MTVVIGRDSVSLKEDFKIDPFTRKDWYVVKAPVMFANKNVGKTLINRTQSTKIASEGGLKHRAFEVSLADLQNEANAERSFRKFCLIAEDVQSKSVLCNFHGMDLTPDKLRSMSRSGKPLLPVDFQAPTACELPGPHRL